MSEGEGKFSKEGLKKSVDLVGKLLPVIEDERTGEILEGIHRLEIDPNWERKKITTRNDVQATLVKIHAHYRRVRDKEETKRFLLKLARGLEKSGMYEKNEICARVSEIVPYTPEYVRELLPDEYRDLKHASPTKTSFGSETRIYPPKTPKPKPKIDLQPAPPPEKEQKPEDLKKKLFEKCPFCGISFDYLKKFSLDEQLKLQKQHMDIHAKPPTKKKPTEIQDMPLHIPTIIPKYCWFMQSLAASLAKCNITSCNECEFSRMCSDAMRYLPVKWQSA